MSGLSAQHERMFYFEHYEDSNDSICSHIWWELKEDFARDAFDRVPDVTEIILIHDLKLGVERIYK